MAVAVTFNEARLELERELRMRRRAYPKWVRQGTLTQEDSDKQMARLQAAIDILNDVSAEKGHHLLIRLRTITPDDQPRLGF